MASDMSPFRKATILCVCLLVLGGLYWASEVSSLPDAIALRLHSWRIGRADTEIKRVVLLNMTVKMDRAFWYPRYVSLSRLVSGDAERAVLAQLLLEIKDRDPIQDVYSEATRSAEDAIDNCLAVLAILSKCPEVETVTGTRGQRLEHVQELLQKGSHLPASGGAFCE